MTRILVAGGTLLDQSGERRADLVIVDGRISEVAPSRLTTSSSATTIEPGEPTQSNEPSNHPIASNSVRSSISLAAASASCNAAAGAASKGPPGEYRNPARSGSPGQGGRATRSQLNACAAAGWQATRGCAGGAARGAAARSRSPDGASPGGGLRGDRPSTVAPAR